MTMRTTESIAKKTNVIRGSFKTNILLRLVRRMQAWYRNRLAIQELQAMPDVLLRDIGIERYQIAEVVKKGGDSITEFRPLEIDSAVAPLKKAAA